jgi:hypothetical protein
MTDSQKYLHVVPSRTKQHNGDSSQRILSDKHDLVGMSGELAFGEFSGLWPDTSLKREGDSGVDFRIRLEFTVDVKTARKALNLIHEQGKPFADIYVLAQFNEDNNSSTLLGWELGRILKGAPTRDFGYGVINHYIPAEKLRPMNALYKKLRR